MNDYYYLQMLTKKREENIHKFPHTKLHQAHSCFSLFFFDTRRNVLCVYLYMLYMYAIWLPTSAIDVSPIEMPAVVVAVTAANAVRENEMNRRAA